MEQIKLIAIDLGGSLLTDNNEITKDTISILKMIKQHDILIALITARMYSSTKYISNVIDADYGIFGNGASIIDLKEKRPISTEYISNDLAKELIAYGKEKDLYIHLNRLFYETSDENKYFAMKHNLLNRNYPNNLKSNIEVVDDLNKCVDDHNDIIKVVYVSENNMDSILDDIKEEFPQVYITEYNTNLYETAIDKTINYIEIGITNRNKADGLKELADVLELTSDEVLVIGDGDNDVEMFKRYDKSGCLSNGSIEAKKYASYVSEYSNNDLGVTDIIKKYVRGI